MFGKHSHGRLYNPLTARDYYQSTARPSPDRDAEARSGDYTVRIRTYINERYVDMSTSCMSTCTIHVCGGILVKQSCLPLTHFCYLL